MRILKIEIEAFGKLEGLALEPADGITLIEGENESGKSTLLAFLRFMFYGFPKGRGPESEERDKRLSWRSRCAEGRLTLEVGDICYRINRRAYLRGSASRENLCEELTVLRLPEGETVTLDGKTPGEYFLGLPPELYEGSLCMTQTGADRVCAPGVGEAMGDLLFAGEASFSAEDAMSRLELARRDLKHLKGRGGRIAELEDELSSLEGALATAGEDALRLSELRADTDRHRARANETRNQLKVVSSALEAAELDRTLALFDDRANALREEARCRAILEQERAAGALPDRAFVERVALALRRSLDEQSRVARLTPEIALLESMDADDTLLRGAESIERMGGSTAAFEKIEKRRRKTRRCTVTGIVFAVLSAAAGFASRLLPALELYALAGCGILLLVALGLFFGAARTHSRVKAVLSLLDAPKGDLLRTYLERMVREAALRRSNGERLRAAREEMDQAQRALEEANVCLERELIAVGRGDLLGDPDRITDFLEEVAHRRGEQQTSLSQATIALERAVGVTEALSRSLSGADEAALRARRATLPAVSEDGDRLRQRQSLLQQTLEGLERKTAEGERAESALAATARDPEILERERARTAEVLTEARRKLNAVCLAKEAMEAATEELRRSITPKLCRETARIFNALTDGVHGELRLASDFSVTLEENGVPRPLSHFSAGCRDAVHLSLRLALLGTLSEEPLPLFFDEALARLDDNRAKALLDVIIYYCEQGGQCLLFTCHTREARMLAKERGVKRFAMPD